MLIEWSFHCHPQLTTRAAQPPARHTVAMDPFEPTPTGSVLDARMQLLLIGRLRRRCVFPASGQGRSNALLRAVGLAATVAPASMVHLAYTHKFPSCAWPRRPHSPRVGGLHPRALAGAVRGHQQRAVDAAEGHPVRSGARDGWWACYWQRLARYGGRRWPCGHLPRVFGSPGTKPPLVESEKWVFVRVVCANGL